MGTFGNIEHIFGVGETVSYNAESKMRIGTYEGKSAPAQARAMNERRESRSVASIAPAVGFISVAERVCHERRRRHVDNGSVDVDQ